MPSNYFDQYDDAEEVAVQAPSGNYFDQYDEPEPPPKQFNLQATRDVQNPTVFDEENDDLRRHTEYQALQDAYPVHPAQGMADFVAPVMQGAETLLKPMGFSWENAIKGQREMEQMPWLEQAATNLAGFDTGMAKIGDALINFPAGLIQQAGGVPPQERWRSDMEGAVENWAPVKKLQEEAPHAFSVAEGVGAVAAPVPMLGPARFFKGWDQAVKAGSPLATMGNIAAGGGIVAGALGGGEAVKQNRQIEPMDVVAPALAGGLFAGGLAGGVVGLGKAGQAAAQSLSKADAMKAAKAMQQQVKQGSQDIAKRTVETFNKLRPAEQKQVLQGHAEHYAQRDQQEAAQKLMNNLGIQDAESRAAVGAMGGQVTDGLPLAPPPMPVTGPPSPPALVKRNPDPRLPRTLREARPRYSNWKPRFNSDLDLALYTVANRGEKSRADDRYYKWIQEATGWDDATILKNAREVKQAVKNAPRSSAEEFPVPRTSNKYLEEIEAVVEEAQAAKTPEEAKEIVQDWAEQVTGKPVDFSVPETPPPVPSTDPVRKTLDREFYGRKKNELAKPATEYDADVRTVVEEIAQRKAAKDYHELVYQNALEATWKKFVKTDVDEFKLSESVTLKKKDVYPDVSPKIQRQIDKEYEALTTGVEDSNEAKHIAATLSKKFGGEDGHFVEEVAIPDSPEAAAAKLTELKGLAKISEKNYEYAKASKVKARIEDVERMIEKAEGAKKPNAERIANLKAELMRLEGDKHFADFAEGTVSKHSDFHVKTEVPHPAGEQHGNIEVAIEHKFNAQQKILPDDRTAYWNARKAEILRQDEKYVPTPKVTANIKGLTKYGAVMAGVVAAASNQAANAAEIGAKVASHPDVLGMWAHMPFNELLIGAAIVKAKLPQKAAQKLLSAEMTGVKGIPIGSLWKDTMDHIAYADRVLNKVNAELAKKHGWQHEDVNLSQQVWERLGQAMRATWGVKISPEAREAALGALREGHITMDEALAGKLDSGLDDVEKEVSDAIALFAGMNQRQRNAVIMYRIVQKDILAKVTDRHDELKAYLKENPKAPNMDAAKQALVSLEYMARQLGKRSESTHPIDATIAKAVSKWMDFNFFWNPDHHGTNLTDMFIAGSSRVGLRNIWRANKLLASEKELQGLFKNSNLTGGYRADQAEVGQLTGVQKGKIWTEHDIQSDLVNADRVFLGHALQYFQAHEKEIAAAGFKGSEVDFAKALYKDDALPPEVVMDVWAKSAETLSRTLGVDVYRINTNIINQAPVARSLGIFMRQPARLSRLAMNYMAEGNFKALYTMLGVVLVAGGRAAIPTDLHWLVENMNPDSANKAAALADSIDLYYRATGEKLSPKITWSILWPVLGAMNPVGAVSKGPLHMTQGVVEGKWEGIWKGIQETVPFTVPRVLGAPAGTLLRTANAAKGAFLDNEKKAYVERWGRLEFSETGRKPLEHWADKIRFAAGPLVPGRDAWAENYKMSKDEQYHSENNAVRGLVKLAGQGDHLPAPRAVDNQYYRDEAEVYDITRQGYNDGYNLLDAIAGRSKKR